MGILSWIFLTAATAVSILVGSWMASSPNKRMNFDKAILAASIFGVVLIFIGSLIVLAAGGGLSLLAVLELIVTSAIAFAVTTVIAWLMLRPWTNGLRDRLNSQFQG